jgi:hypothetical protein
MTELVNVVVMLSTVAVERLRARAAARVVGGDMVVEIKLESVVCS